MPKPQHIAAIQPKSAAVIAGAVLEDDPYHRCIQRGATILNALLPAYDWRYLTQVGEHTTYWLSKQPKANAAVGEREVNVTDTINGQPHSRCIKIRPQPASKENHRAHTRTT